MEAFFDVSAGEVEDLILIKITKKEFVKSLLDGRLYMNNLKFFVDLEKTTKKQGIGDIREASLVNIKKHRLFIQKEGEEIVEIPIGDAPGIIYDRSALYHPVFCSIGKTIKYNRTNSGQMIGEIILSEDELKDFIEEENDYQAVVIFDIYTFLERVRIAMDKLSIGGKCDSVIYRDMNTPRFVNNSWVLDDTFTKDIRFKNQSEFRIELFLHKENPYILDVGSLSDIACVIDWKVLLKGISIQIEEQDRLD